MDYIQVENGNIIGYPRKLPTVFADVSNFHVLDNERLRSYGWYPVRFVPAQKDSMTVVTGQLFVVEGIEVVQYEQVRQKTQDEITLELNQYWDVVRMRRNTLLQESDWTQLQDVPLSAEKKQEWVIYRQQLRDITATYTNPYEIIWPSLP